MSSVFGFKCNAQNSNFCLSHRRRKPQSHDLPFLSGGFLISTTLSTKCLGAPEIPPI